jgi:hypothetical protein
MKNESLIWFFICLMLLWACAIVLLFAGCASTGAYQMSPDRPVIYALESNQRAVERVAQPVTFLPPVPGTLPANPYYYGAGDYSLGGGIYP